MPGHFEKWHANLSGHSIFQKQPETMDKNKLGNYISSVFTKKVGMPFFKNSPKQWTKISWVII
jgi:hypothetical protein